MVDGRIHNLLRSVKSYIYNRCNAHATTATINNNRFTTYCISEIRLEKKDSESKTKNIHHLIFDAIKKIDNIAVNISIDKTHTSHSKHTSENDEYKRIF